MIKTQGIILSEIRFKESSKILNVYTKKLGKISLMAQGAYKPKSHLLAATQPFANVEFQLRTGRNFYYISGADLINSFYSIRGDLERLAYGFYLLELLEKSTPDEEQNEKLFLLLEKGLGYLSGIDKDYLKFIVAYELKYISFIGYKPHLENCVVCNKKLEGKVKFSTILGGVLGFCCIYNDITAKNINNSVLSSMNKLLYSTFEELASLNINKNILNSIHDIIVDYILNCIERREFKSLSLVKTLIGP
ncbi:DNA repair protein RecO [Tissierella creatinini]|nr:DNA repair protein RecO [Tissierella creatinini]TJX67161.1 DNA repair protein RecO [Soehngenia saccharolytica]